MKYYDKNIAILKIGLILLCLLCVNVISSELFCQTIDDYLITTVDRFSNNGADYLVISHDNYITSLLPLLNFRNEQGLKVKVVPLSFIYSYVDTSINSRTESIKEVISYAYKNWQPKPRFILLIGDANENDELKDYCPAPRRPIFEYLCSICTDTFYTSDNWYVELTDTSYIPVIAIGRLPVKTTTETETIIQKIINYESNLENHLYSKNVTLISSAEYLMSIDPVSTYFSETSLELNVIRTDSLSCNTTNDLIIDAFNSGQLFIFVFTHAHFFNRLWFGECAQNEVDTIFSSLNIPNLTNEYQHPFIFTFG